MRAKRPFFLALAILVGSSCGLPGENDFDSTADAGEDPGGSGGSAGESPTGGSAGVSPTGGSPTGGSAGRGGTSGGEGGASARAGAGGTETGGESGSSGIGAQGGSDIGGAGKGGIGGAGAGGRGGMSGGGSGGRGGAGGAVICDPGCEPSANQGNACDEAEVLWNCRNDEGLERFDAACDALPTGDPRFCCPETFSPTCGEGTCGRFPQADEMLCGGDAPPRGYRCLFPVTSLPNCVARVAGDVTTLVCCP